MYKVLYHGNGFTATVEEGLTLEEAIKVKSEQGLPTISTSNCELVGTYSIEPMTDLEVKRINKL